MTRHVTGSLEDGHLRHGPDADSALSEPARGIAGRGSCASMCRAGDVVHCPGAVSAAPAEPADRHPVADRPAMDLVAQLRDDPGDLVPGDDREAGTPAGGLGRRRGWRMNTQAEIRQAFLDSQVGRSGTIPRQGRLRYR